MEEFKEDFTKAKILSDYLLGKEGNEELKELKEDCDLLLFLYKSVYTVGDGLDEDDKKYLNELFKNLSDKEKQIIFKEYDDLREKYSKIIKDNAHIILNDCNMEQTIGENNRTYTYTDLFQTCDPFNMYMYEVYTDILYLFNDCFIFLTLINHNRYSSSSDEQNEVLDHLNNSIIKFLDRITDPYYFIEYYFDFLRSLSCGKGIGMLYNMMKKHSPYDMEQEGANENYKLFILATSICDINLMVSLFNVGFEHSYSEENITPCECLYILNSKNFIPKSLSISNKNYHRGYLDKNDVALYVKYNYLSSEFVVGIPRNVYELVDRFPSNEYGVLENYLPSKFVNINRELVQIYKYNNLEDLIIHCYLYILSTCSLSEVKNSYNTFLKDKNIIKFLPEDRVNYLHSVGKYFEDKIKDDLKSRVDLACYLGNYCNGIVIDDFSFVLNDKRY